MDIDNYIIRISSTSGNGYYYLTTKETNLPYLISNKRIKDNISDINIFEEKDIYSKLCFIAKWFPANYDQVVQIIKVNKEDLLYSLDVPKIYFKCSMGLLKKINRIF